MTKTECGNPIEYVQICKNKECNHISDCTRTWSDEIYLNLQAKKYESELLISKKNNHDKNN